MTTNLLHVMVHDTTVGILSLNQNDGSEFRLVDSYKRAYPRPVLGQQFLDDLEQVHHSRARVPPWFSNLLPEGPLRELVARQVGVSSSREFFLLHRLGEDLPGAVRIIAEKEVLEPDGEEESSVIERESNGDWHFSLAGVQLKFSAQRNKRGLTIPVSGRGGDWIVKLPDARYPRVPENEFATMRWAEASGIRIPELALVDLADITGLPATLGVFHESMALAIRRFDRPEPGRRIHMEDFAQILGLYPEEKYAAHNYETLARLIFALTGKHGLDEFIRRLVFVILSGNGDAHHKNWSLVYPDGIKAELSPAYDLVSIIQYMQGDQMALNLAKSKRWEDVRLESFRRMARKIGFAEESMVSRVQASVDAIMAAWRESKGEFGYTAEARGTLEKHFARIPLLRESNRNG